MTATTTIDTTNPAAKAAMFRRLEDLYRDCQQGTDNKHAHAIVLIAACIDEGITAGPEIVGTVAHFGLNKKHVGAVLGKNLDYLWARDPAGTYAALPPLD